MWRHWMFGTAVLGSIILIAVGVYYLSTHPQVPPPLEARDCALTAPHDETPNARFARKGGRTFPAKVWREGTALTAYNVAQNRDLRVYDRLELTDPEPRIVADGRRDPILAQARSFLWQHWRDRKRAYLVLTLSSVDATSTSHVFIEPNGVGRWRVCWTRVRHNGEVDDSPTDYSMEWVTPGDWNKPGTQLPPGQEPDPLKHKLEFRDACGDVDGSF